MIRVSNSQRRARLGVRHHLAQPAAGPVEAADAQVGLHSSDPVSVFLSAWARLDNMTVEGLEQCLYEEQGLLRLTGMRGTMFVVSPRLAAVVDAACTRARFPGEFRRIVKWVEEQGLATDGASWVNRLMTEVTDALRRRGEPATAAQLKEDVPDLGKKLSFGEGKAYAGTVGMSTRMFFLLAAAGQIVRARPKGSWVSGQYTWALTDHWVGELDSIRESEARADLVARWLHAYGPGTFTDVQWWTGWGKAVTRQALDEAGAVEVALEDGVGFLRPDDLESVARPRTWVALLPSLDPTTMGWKERDWYLGGHGSALFDHNGNGGPTIWADGRIVGGWAQTCDGRVEIEMLEEVSGAHQRRIDREARRLEQWLGAVRFRTRFPVPLEKELR